MSRFVVAAFRPKPGHQQALERLMHHHYVRLRAEGLVTDRQPVLMRAHDGTIVEIFEWLSPGAIRAAESNHAVQRMWRDYAEVCDTVPLDEMSEAHTLLAEFEPVAADRQLHPEFSP